MTLSRKRARIEQKRKALQLLTLSGAIRAADVEARYRGSETVLGVAARPQEMPRGQDSIWWMDLTAVFKAFQASQSAPRSRRKIFNTPASSRSGMTGKSPASRAA